VVGARLGAGAQRVARIERSEIREGLLRWRLSPLGFAALNPGYEFPLNSGYDFALARFGRRTARSFPLLPPPQ
jgi:hypothetical protein